MSEPVKRVKVGNVSGALWANNFEKDGQQKTIYSWSFQKSYKKGEEWHNVNSYNEGELYKLRAMIDHIIGNMVAKQNEPKAEGQAPQSPPVQPPAQPSADSIPF